MVSSHTAEDAAGMPEVGTSRSCASRTAGVTVTNYGALSVSEPKPIGVSGCPKKKPTSGKRLRLMHYSRHKQTRSFCEALRAAAKLQAEAASTAEPVFEHVCSGPELAGATARPVSVHCQCCTPWPLWPKVKVQPPARCCLDLAGLLGRIRQVRHRLFFSGGPPALPFVAGQPARHGLEILDVMGIIVTAVTMARPAGSTG